MISKIFRFSLRTKIILITTCLLLLVVFSICYYLLNTQRQNYIKREIAFQESTSGLLADSVSSQYFNYINQQIIELLNERINLKNKTSIIAKEAHIKRYRVESNSCKMIDPGQTVQTDQPVLAIVV